MSHDPADDKCPICGRWTPEATARIAIWDDDLCNCDGDVDEWGDFQEYEQ